MSVEDGPVGAETVDVSPTQESAEVASTSQAAQAGAEEVEPSTSEKSNRTSPLDSPTSSSPTSSTKEVEKSTVQESNRADSSGSSTSSIQNPKSKIRNGKRPYVRQKPFVQSPKQQAASMANMQKAKAAPKEKIYAQTPKRKASQLANLAIAHARNRQPREQAEELLDRTLPPLRHETPASVPGASELGTDSGESQRRTEEAEQSTAEKSTLEESNPPFDPSAPSTQNPKSKSHNGEGWVFDWPRPAGAVHRQAPGYPVLEKAARSILHRQRAILYQARREAQHVMRLLIRAAQQSATASREDFVALAGRLLMILTHSRVLARSVQLNWQIKKRLKAFVKERYGEKLDLTGLWAEIRLRAARRLDSESPPTASAQEGASPEPGSEADAGSSAPPRPRWRHRRRRKTLTGPDLPEKLEHFQALFRLAFGVLNPEPEQERQAEMLDKVAANLWDVLHLFEGFVGEERERFGAHLEELGEGPPQHGQDIVERCCRCCYIAMLVEEDRNLEGMRKGYLRTFYRNLGRFLRERYGPSPQLDYFFRIQ